jgi:hypothetical protein
VCGVVARSQKRLSGLHGRDGRGRTSNTTHEYSIRNACHVTLRYEFPRIEFVILYNTIENAIRKRYAVVIKKPYVLSPGTCTAEHMVRVGSGGDGGSALPGNDGDAAHCQSNVGATSLATDGPPASIDTGHGHRVTRGRVVTGCHSPLVCARPSAGARSIHKHLLRQPMASQPCASFVRDLRSSQQHDRGDVRST